MINPDDDRQRALRDNVIHVGSGFLAKEHSHVLDVLSTLAPHLGRWDSSQVDIEVTLQDRGGKQQRVTLRTTLPGRPQLVAVADNPDLTRALADAKRELIGQLEHQKSEREPMHNRRLRDATIRHPDQAAPHAGASRAVGSTEREATGDDDQAPSPQLN